MALAFPPRRPLRAPRTWQGVVVLLLVALLYAAAERAGDWLQAPDADAPGAAAILRAYAEGTSGVMVETEGVVEAVLRDDLRGSRHQRLIVRVAPDHTVLVSHNIDLAPRVDGIAEGDRLEFRGQYEWNERGGVVHWTHHDPDGRRPGGFLRYEGRTYR